jgi:glycosyltransferase involved in cell wall biosynthesis
VKILIVTGIFPPDIGGPATYIPQIARGLSERGHEVKVLTTSEPEDLSKDDTLYPFPVFRMNRRTPIWYRAFYYIRHILRYGRDADVLYGNGIFLEIALANLRLRKPLVIKVVGDEAWERATRRGWSNDGFEEFQCRRQPELGELLKHLRSWAVKRADKVIVPSRYLAQWIAKWGMPERKFTVIYNAVTPIDGIEPAEVPLLTPVKVVTVGRLVPWKRIDGIIRAIYGFDNTGLVVIGDGPERHALKALVKKLEMAERVYFAGERSKKETLSLMSASDLFVLNSSYEGLPHVVLEAMSLGLPVLATAIGGTTEIVRNGYNGILYEYRGDKLNTVLKQLVENKRLRMRLASNARMTAKKSFNCGSMTEQTESILLRLARGQNS